MTSMKAVIEETKKIGWKNELTFLEETIINRRKEGYTFRRIATEYGISIPYAYKIQCGALKKMRSMDTDDRLTRDTTKNLAGGTS